MPKTWDDGPPRTTKDSWILGHRRLVEGIAGASLVHSLAVAENWQAEIPDEEIDRHVVIATRTFEILLEQTPRTDGKTWAESPENEEDGWAFERLSGLLGTVVGLTTRKQRTAGEEWKQDDDGTLDDDIRAAIEFAKRVQKAVDKAVPRIG